MYWIKFSVCAHEKKYHQNLCHFCSFSLIMQCMHDVYKGLAIQQWQYGTCVWFGGPPKTIAGVYVLMCRVHTRKSNFRVLIYVLNWLVLSLVQSFSIPGLVQPDSQCSQNFFLGNYEYCAKKLRKLRVKKSKITD